MRNKEKQTISDALEADQTPADLSPTRESGDRRGAPPFSSPEARQTISDALEADEASTDSSPHRIFPNSKHSSPVDLAARSSVSSLGSHLSSLSHGSSPREQENPVTPTEIPPGNSSENHLPPQSVVNRSVRDDPVAVTAINPKIGENFTSGLAAEEGGNRRSRSSLSILRRTKIDAIVKKSALGFRVFGMVFCLVSFAVMVADKNQGWALDSFHRYKEFRYSMSVNVIGFVYSGAQACYLAYHLATGKYVSRHPLRYYFDFSLDQILTYLLISASSSAATRIDDWISNWGKDKFPDMATASVAMSFLAFLALASSSLISGYVLFTFEST